MENICCRTRLEFIIRTNDVWYFKIRHLLKHLLRNYLFLKSTKKMKSVDLMDYNDSNHEFSNAMFFS